MTRKRILFVDDEANVLQGLQNMLRKHRGQWDTAFALGADAALAELARAPFDVVVSDMRMPGMDGATLLKRVRHEFPHVTRIVLSGHADRDAVMRALPVAHQYLSKPCDADLLRQVIEQACRLQNLLHDGAVRTIVGRVDSLPSVPRCYEALTNAIARGEGVAVIAGIVHADPAMTAKVLQVVNSAYFGAGRRIASVRQAVSYLGSELVHALAATAERFEATTEEPLPSGFGLEALQEHSLATAQLASTMVTEQQHKEEAFCAAILHDIGKIVLALEVPKHYAQVLDTARREGRPEHHVERELMSVTHAEVGAYLLGLWGVPSSIVDAVAYHHAPRRLPSGPHELVAAVHVADALAHGAARGRNRGVEPMLLDEPFLTELGWTSSIAEWKGMAAPEHVAAAGR